MAKTPLLMFLLFISCKQSEIKCTNNYEDYNILIKEGQNLLGRDNQEGALNCYLRAFDIVCDAFALDIFDAANIAKSLNNDEVIKKMMYLLCAKGVQNKFFQQTLFNHLIIDDCRKGKEINEELKFKLNALYTKDQNIDRTKDTKWNEFQKTTHEFKYIVEKYGFPSERRVGVNVINDTIISKQKSHVLLVHSFQLGDNYFMGKLDSLMKTGDISGGDKQFFMQFNL